MKKYFLAEDAEQQQEVKRGSQPDEEKSQFRLMYPTRSDQKMLPENALSLQVKHTGSISAGDSAQPVDKTKAGSESVQKIKIWFVGFLREKNTRNIAAVFIFLVLGTFLLKKMVDGLVEKTFPVEHKAAIISNLVHKEKLAGKEYQNALVTVIVPPETEKKKQLPPPEKIKNIRKQVSLKGTRYTVGYFGGVSGLKLTVSNKSGHLINQVELEIDFLKHNGEIIETDTYQLRYIKAHSSQTLCVPPSRNGVKVKYKIMNIYARQYSLLKEI